VVWHDRKMLRISGILIEVITLRWLLLAFRSSQSVQAENLLVHFKILTEVAP
jgi:hypothetical protein